MTRACPTPDECTVVLTLRAEIEKLRAALEDARRDFNGMCPRSDTGSKRKKIIEAAVKRIEAALEQNVGESNAKTP